MWSQGGASSRFGQLVTLWWCKICASHLMEIIASANMGDNPAALCNQGFGLFQQIRISVNKCQKCGGGEDGTALRNVLSVADGCFRLYSVGLEVFQSYCMTILLDQWQASAASVCDSGLRPSRLVWVQYIYLHDFPVKMDFLFWQNPPAYLKEHFLLCCIEALMNESV